MKNRFANFSFLSNSTEWGSLKQSLARDRNGKMWIPFCTGNSSPSLSALRLNNNGASVFRSFQDMANSIVDKSNEPSIGVGPVGVGPPSPACCSMDYTDTLHIGYLSDAGAGIYSAVTFDTINETWGTPVVLKDDLSITANQYSWNFNNIICIDKNNDVHVVFVIGDRFMGTNYATIWYTNNIGGSYKAVVEVWGASTELDAALLNMYISEASNVPIISFITLGASNLQWYHSTGNTLNATSFSNQSFTPWTSTDLANSFGQIRECDAIYNSDNHQLYYAYSHRTSTVDYIYVGIFDDPPTGTSFKHKYRIKLHADSENLSAKLVNAGARVFIILSNNDNADERISIYELESGRAVKKEVIVYLEPLASGHSRKIFIGNQQEVNYSKNFNSIDIFFPVSIDGHPSSMFIPIPYKTLV